MRYIFNYTLIPDKNSRKFLLKTFLENQMYSTGIDLMYFDTKNNIFKNKYSIFLYIAVKESIRHLDVLWGMNVIKITVCILRKSPMFLFLY